MNARKSEVNDSLIARSAIKQGNAQSLFYGGAGDVGCRCVGCEATHE